MILLLEHRGKKSCMSPREAIKACEYPLALCLHPDGVNKMWGLAVKGQWEGRCGWILNFWSRTMKVTTPRYITFLLWSSFQYWLCVFFCHNPVFGFSVCSYKTCYHLHTHTFCITGHHIPYQRKSSCIFLEFTSWTESCYSAPCPHRSC